jgi:hypothetical protein
MANGRNYLVLIAKRNPLKGLRFVIATVQNRKNPAIKPGFSKIVLYP